MKVMQEALSLALWLALKESIDLVNREIPTSNLIRHS